MARYNQTTLAEYLEKLAAREPVPGGGSAAALSACLGVALIQMVAKYSLGKGKPKSVDAKIASIDKTAGVMRAQLLSLVSEDAEAYLAIVAARKLDKKAQAKAAKAAGQVSREIKKISVKALAFLPYLRQEGNVYLLSDVDAAAQFLKAAVATSDVMIKANV